MDEAKAIIEAMRLRCQCRGRQIMAYRKKLHQQVCYRVYYDTTDLLKAK